VGLQDFLEAFALSIKSLLQKCSLIALELFPSLVSQMSKMSAGQCKSFLHLFTSILFEKWVDTREKVRFLSLEALVLLYEQLNEHYKKCGKDKYTPFGALMTQFEQEMEAQNQSKFYRSREMVIILKVFLLQVNLLKLFDSFYNGY
jgi:hypothetical protein